MYAGQDAKYLILSLRDQIKGYLDFVEKICVVSDLFED